MFDNGRDDEELLAARISNDVLEFNGGKSFASSTVIIQFSLLLFGFFIPKKMVYITMKMNFIFTGW